jgi:hypothetical protein
MISAVVFTLFVLTFLSVAYDLRWWHRISKWMGNP